MSLLSTETFLDNTKTAPGIPFMWKSETNWSLTSKQLKSIMSNSFLSKRYVIKTWVKILKTKLWLTQNAFKTTLLHCSKTAFRRDSLGSDGERRDFQRKWNFIWIVYFRSIEGKKVQKYSLTILNKYSNKKIREKY